MSVLSKSMIATITGVPEDELASWDSEWEDIEGDEYNRALKISVRLKTPVTYVVGTAKITDKEDPDG